MDIKETIRRFIVDYLLSGDESKTIDDDDSFLEREIIDSTGVLELASFIEETFDISVADEELIPDNLDSINRLVTYIQSKLKSK